MQTGPNKREATFRFNRTAKALTSAFPGRLATVSENRPDLLPSQVGGWRFPRAAHSCIGIIVGTAICVAIGETAKADDNVPSVLSPPAHTDLRYNEDYSYLEDPAARTN